MRLDEEGHAIVSRVRWAILALLFVSTVINYLDRQALSILASTVQLDLNMTDLAYAHVVQLFLLAYTAAYLVAGRLTDKLGSKLALALFVGWWSIANMMTGLVRNATELGATRFALGLGEAGNYTAGPKIVSEAFAPRERGLALGIYTAGAMVGATLAPPLIGGVALTFGWRAAFIATGAAGLVWLVAWVFVHPGSPPVSVDEPVERETALWAGILRDPTIWLLALARAVADSVWYFYLFWFPKYLMDERGLQLVTVAASAWIVYLAADLGSIGGGLLSSRLVAGGSTPPRARIMAMGMAAAVAPIGIIGALHPSLPILYLVASCVACAHLVFQVNISTLIIDLYPARRVATVFGVIAAGSGIGGLVSTQAVGMLVTGGAFDQAFVLMAALHPAAWAIAFAAFKLATRSRKT